MYLIPQALHHRKEDVNDVLDFVDQLVGHPSRRGSAMASPISSMPSTPVPTMIPGPSGLSASGRLSRQSDATSDRVSSGTTMVTSGNEPSVYR